MPLHHSQDQLGNSITVTWPLTRIVSLVPSQSELLFDLGLDAEVAGITKFCIHPEGWIKSKTIVGGTKKFDFEAIDKLQPDLIIGNKEENYKEGIEHLQSRYPVWISDLESFQDAIAMIGQIGLLVNRKERADELVKRIKDSFTTLPSFQSKKVLYLIWRKPWMAVGSDTFIDDILRQLKFSNVVDQSRYPELTEEAIEVLNPEVILLSSEPFPFAEKHIHELHAICPHATIEVVDGEMFSWYGSRLQYAPTYFQQLYERMPSKPTAFKSFQ